MAPLVWTMVGIPILSIAAGGFGKDRLNLFFMGFFRDLARIKAHKRSRQKSNGVVPINGVATSTWDILMGRDDPGIDFLQDDSVGASSTSSETTFTARELFEFGNGRDERPIYLSIFGRVYDVSKGEKFYGKGAAYEMFAGRDVTRALCLGCLEPECLVRSTEGLTQKQLQEGKRWLSFFHTHDKYQHVGNMETLDSEARLDTLVESAALQQ